MAGSGGGSGPSGDRPDSAPAIGAELDRIEAAIGAGERRLGAVGFWRVVRRLKLDPASAEAFAERVGRIDREAFERTVRVRIPVPIGNAALALGMLVGALAIVVAIEVTNPTVAAVALLASAAILSVSVHDLAHWAAGRAAGIRFVAYFPGGPLRIQPGLKTDYASYLRARPEARAAMHASGALASKAAPFVSLAFSPASHAAGWAFWAVLGFGLAQIVTDVVWSTKRSDWKRARRERAIARELGGA